ncbi:MAG: hypothetical protein HOP97_03130 [Terrabacter sp.]|nr:hypothetical protein [Dermatophilaceae bacterium]NUS40604.1 hypothetical protein [Terrabacter sp.]
MSLRELVAALASIEDRMRHLPTLVAFRGQLVPNPERRLLLRRQEAVIATLRRRRTTLRSATRHH